ncbi:hypothetical protein M408DRAFT_329322 [Serendipita vermifera MAFF 305830]|uniref:Elongin-A n=1 Tax=Serendipita vermifera MAFF 305830 TaxID=933852 RepID=A0A0C3AWJ8_SERVB|nr:hypothetical protein M408DRAFT_329322 [Serendipita vermifera MAFF 305830]
MQQTESQPAVRVPSLTHYCYQTVAANLERISSLGFLPYRLAKPILERCPSELLIKLEQEFTEWQSIEYLELIDVEIWQPRCMELLGPNGLESYAQGGTPSSWRREYAKLSMRRQTDVTRASDRVSKFREAQESDQRKAKLTQDLPPIRRKPGSNPLLAISNPAFRKVVADTKRFSTGPTGVHSGYFMRPPRPIGTMPIRNSRSSPVTSVSSPSRSHTSTSSSSPQIPRSTLFIPKARPPG